VNVFSAIEFAGKLVLGGRREGRPSMSAFGKTAVFRAGFDMLSRGDDAINHVLKTIAADKKGRAHNKERGLRHLFGWAYPTAKDSQDFGAIFTARMIEVAAAQDGLARSVDEVKQRTKLIDAADLSRELGIAKRRVREIAVALGIRQSSSRSYVAFSEEEARLLRRTVVELIDRDEAASFLDVARPFFDSLVHLGLIPVFVRMRGPGMDRFRPQDIHSFAASLIERVDRLETGHLTGRMLKEVRRSSRTNPARLVQQLIDGVIPTLGRRGESFGSITIPAEAKRNTLRYPRNRILDDANGVGMLDAAAALGVDHSAIVELRKLKFLKHSKSSPKLLDRYGFDIFCKTYCASRHYAPLLKCRPQELPRRLRDLGIKVLRLDRGRGGIHLVDRADARRVIGLLSDPDAAPIGPQRAFTAGLVEHVRKATTFRLLSQIDGLTFRTGKGTFRLFMTIDWERDTLRIGPKYNSRKSPRAQSDLLQRKSQIETAFGRELTWTRDNDWLRVFTSVENLNFDKPARWADIYAQIVEIFAEFKKHFEPPQRRSL
jgi:hypothetical protein